MTSNVSLPPYPQPWAAPLPSGAQLSSDEEMRRKRWIWYGYRAAAQHMASDNDFFVLRRFATSNTRVILAKQVEIMQIERDLDLLDDPKPGERPPVNNSTILQDQRSGRPEKMQELWAKLKDYSGSTSYCLTCFRLRSQGLPAHRRIRCTLLATQISPACIRVRAKEPSELAVQLQWGHMS